MSNRRLTSKEIDELLDEIVTEDFIINALKEFNLYPDKEKNKDFQSQEINKSRKIKIEDKIAKH